MFVVYTFAALIGTLFAALTWLRVAPAPADPPAGEAAPASVSASGPMPASYRRSWALPLGVFGLVGLTLHLLDRPFLHTLVLSLVVGPPLGLLVGWVTRLINGGWPSRIPRSPPRCQ